MEKKYKILRVSHLYYKEAEKDFLNRNPEINQLNYEDSLAKLLSQKINNGDGITIALRKKGHEAKEIVFDLEWLQKKWAAEKKHSYDESEWIPSILLGQIIEYKPDILFFQHYPPLNFDVWKNIREYCPSIKCVVIHRAWPGDWETAGAADVLLVGTRKMVQEYRSHGSNAQLMYHYFDETILDEIKTGSYFYDATFIGSSGVGYGNAHAARYWYLNYLLENSKMQAWLDEVKFQEKTNKNKIKEKIRGVIKGCVSILNLKTLESILDHISKKNVFRGIINECVDEKKDLGIPITPLSRKFPEKCHSALFGLEYYKKIAESKISFQKHIVTANGDVGAIRLFQVTGLGSCLLTDTGPSMVDLFEEDKEVITYKTKEEALNKLNFLMANEKFAREVAEYGKKKTLTHHTASVRADEILSHVHQFLKR